VLIAELAALFSATILALLFTVPELLTLLVALLKEVRTRKKDK
jgi:hypothetical protein